MEPAPKRAKTAGQEAVVLALQRQLRQLDEQVRQLMDARWEVERRYRTAEALRNQAVRNNWMADPNANSNDDNWILARERQEAERRLREAEAHRDAFARNLEEN